LLFLFEQYSTDLDYWISMEHVHFIGIGGTGLSAIASVLLERGYTVSGSDYQESVTTRHLEALGAQVFIGHRGEQVAGADLVVRSSAIANSNLEVQAALAAVIPVLKREDFLEQLMAGQQGIAVAGTHGKTTTTAMLAWLLTDLKRDPSFVIGSPSLDLGGSAHAGTGQFFVIEADEYDRMFLGIHPYVAVVTNVEHDHPDCYPTPQEFMQAFNEFVSQIEPGGILVACGDDPGAAKLMANARSNGQRTASYGMQAEELDYRATQLNLNRWGGFDFDVYRRDSERLARLHLRVPGKHNVLNAMAALSVSDYLGLNADAVANSLDDFHGTNRRFEVRGIAAGVTIIDDYAHHPTEIRATLSAARVSFPGQEIWAVWQPHTYSRTRTLMADFIKSFGDADHVLITEIFAAREEPPADGFSARQIVKAMTSGPDPLNSDVYFAPDLDSALSLILEHVQPGQVVLVLSAGDANQISERLLRTLPARNSSPS
jgi:UDP-N-acetylmuramate--alanine ligase